MTHMTHDPTRENAFGNGREVDRLQARQIETRHKPAKPVIESGKRLIRRVSRKGLTKGSNGSRSIAAKGPQRGQRGHEAGEGRANDRRE
jgi:hypothetical protein